MTQSQAIDSPKARQILTGAKEAFVEFGYEGTSVDEIARRAGVSKGTLYSYFPDKAGLFAAIVQEACQEQARRLFEAKPDEGAIAATLRRIAGEMVAFLLSPFAQDMFRLAVAESRRFPEIGQAFYRSGPELGIRRLNELLTAAHERGELHIEDPNMAAYQFVELCRAELFYKRVFGVKESFSRAEMNRVAEAAVVTFLRAYGGH